MRYTTEERLKIIQEHISQHGDFEASVFLEEAKSPQHPAHGWFTWDDGEAAHQWRLHQARQFAHIRIERQVVESHDLTGGTITIERQSPALVSPLSARGAGGGYILADSPDGQKALKEEAHMMLAQWLNRFRSVLTKTQVSNTEKTIKSLSP